MNYVLRVVRGRSTTTTLKLMDGVNSIGRHDECLIRIRSSQVSRRHCALFEAGGRLMVRDLGSSNGTFVNGKRILGHQALKPGDVLTIGGVSLRVDLAGAPSPAPQAAGAGPVPQPKPGATAKVDAIPIAEEDLKEEFELEFDQEEPEQVEIIPLDE